jgi:acyl carrier protein
MNEKLTKLLSKVFEIPLTSITPELTNADISKWDSLTHMDLITSLEESFEVTFDFDEIVGMTSVGKIDTLLKSKGV